MTEPNCKSDGLCCICTFYGDYCPLNDGKEDIWNGTLFEKASLEELKKRLETIDLTPKEKLIIEASINTYKSYDKFDEDETYEDIDIPIIHPKMDIMIISKAQYNRMISEGIKLEDQLEKLEKRCKELEAKYLQEFNKNINT